MEDTLDLNILKKAPLGCTVIIQLGKITGWYDGKRYNDVEELLRAVDASMRGRPKPT